MNKELKILHLEDSKPDAELVLRQLKKNEWIVVYRLVATKESYITAIRDFHPDVILSDHTLPEFDSLEALKIFKETEKNIPFILVTGTVSEEFAVEIIQAGADDYILKQNLTRLPTAIHNALHKKQLERENRQAIEQLKISEQRYRYLVEQMLEGLQVIGLDYRYLLVNDAVIKQSKYTREEMLGFTMMEKYPGIENTEMFGLLRKCMEERIAQRMENKFVYPDGSEAWFELNFQPVTEGVLILSEEITERKMVEDSLKKSEEKNRALLRAIPDLMFVMNKEGLYLDFKADNESELYLKPEDFLGKKVSEVLPAPLADKVLLFIKRTLQTASMQVFEYSLTIEEHVNFFEARMCPLKKEETILVIVRNISERKKAETEKQNHISGLEEMLSITSHKVRQPIAHILGIAEMLENTNVSEDELKQINGYMQQSASSLDEFTRELTNYMQKMKNRQ